MASGQETLLSYFRAHNENFDKRVGVNRKEGSAKSYWYALGHLTKFLESKIQTFGYSVYGTGQVVY